jgi:hypothetical protein
VAAAGVGSGVADGVGDAVIAGNRPAAFPGLITELLAAAVGKTGSGIGGRDTGVGVGVGVVFSGASLRASVNTRGWGRVIAVVWAVAVRVTVRVVGVTGSWACSLTGVEDRVGSVQEAESFLLLVGQPAVNSAA